MFLENISFISASNRNMVPLEKPTPTQASDHDLSNHEQAIFCEIMDTVLIVSIVSTMCV